MSTDPPPEPRSPADDITARLSAIASDPTPEAWDDLLPMVYDQLRRMAAQRLRHERAGHTLEPTALVHEAYMRLVGEQRASFRNRGHFYAIAARAMRRILIESARRRKTEKRGGARVRTTLDETAADPRSLDADPLELLALDEALGEFAEADPRAARVVELRVFAGLGIDEAAEVLGVGRATVERDWRAAQAWLLARLGSGGDRAP